MKIDIQKIKQEIIDEIRQEYFLVPRTIKTGAEQKVEFMEHILHFVSEYTHVPVQDMRSKSHKNEIISARSFFYYLTKKHCKAIVSLEMMGKFIGGRDHATVMNGVRKVISEMDRNPRFKEQMSDLSQDFFNKYKEEIFNLEHPKPIS